MIALPASYLSDVANGVFVALFPGQPTGLFAVFLEFSGGIIAILGLILAIGGVASPQRIETRYVQAPPQPSANPRQLLIQQFNCKFCGAEIEKDELFCPKCRKAQK